METPTLEPPQQGFTTHGNGTYSILWPFRKVIPLGVGIPSVTNQRKEEPKMGLVYCPKCGEEISDKAISCPHCNFAFSKQNIVKCEECGMEYESNLSAFPVTLAVSLPVALPLSVSLFENIFIFFYFFFFSVAFSISVKFCKIL